VIEPTAQGSPAEHRMSVHLSGTSSEPEPSESFQMLVICHLLLSQIPEQGLPEALESLFEMRQFYRHRPAQLPAAAEPASIPAALGKAYVRPEFHVSED
jgi:hypothetical protein